MVEEIIKQFNINGKLVSVSVNGTGNINNTYIAKFNMNNGEYEKFLIQKINSHVYKNPNEVMENIFNVTSYIKEQLKLTGDNLHKTMEIVSTIDGKSFCTIKKNNINEYYRIFKFVENSISYDYGLNDEIVYNTGRAFGNFQKLLRDFDINKLYETIPNFHNTESRFNDFLNTLSLDKMKRAKSVKKEIEFILKRKNITTMITDRLGKDIPIRVTHNDTKVNNVLMNKDTNDYLCVIDLDTVMPGCLLYDYGDGVRSTVSKTSEDETDLTKVGLDLDMFKSYTDGFLDEMGPFIKKSELSLMAESIRIITLELAMRFLGDYIDGDNYFKINYDNHNLDRAKNQIALVEDIERKMPIIKAYIKNKFKN